MTTPEILEAIEVNYSECLLADGLEDAIVGVVEGAGRDTVICYDYDLCVAVLVGQGMEEEDAREFLDFNTVGAYVGEKTPMFLHNWRAEDSHEPGGAKKPAAAVRGRVARRTQGSAERVSGRPAGVSVPQRRGRARDRIRHAGPRSTQK